jgi:hypothetical protein
VASGANIPAAAARLRNLLPLDEEHVDEFEELVAQFAEVGGVQAAHELLLVLDDACPLGGVMDSVASALHEFRAEDVVPPMLATLAVTTARAPHALRTLLRGILLSPSHRERLKSGLAALDAHGRAALREQLETVAKSPTYRTVSAEVLSLFG